MLKYVYDAGINSISVSTFKNNFLELLVLFPRFFIKKNCFTDRFNKKL